MSNSDVLDVKYDFLYESTSWIIDCLNENHVVLVRSIIVTVDGFKVL